MQDLCLGYYTAGDVRLGRGASPLRAHSQVEPQTVDLIRAENGIAATKGCKSGEEGEV